MKRTFLPIILLILISIGCQKEFSLTDGTTGGQDTTGTGGTMCTTYFPTTQGTFWTYSNTNTADNTLTVVAPDTMINGKAFKRVISNRTQDAFISDDNGYIYQYADLGAYGRVMMNLLRVNAAIGETWKDSSIVNGVTEIFEYEMLEKNITMQISNGSFSNVIHSQFKVMLDSSPYFNNEVVQITNIWFGKCIGPLQIKTVTISMGVTSDTLTSQLKSYQVR